MSLKIIVDSRADNGNEFLCERCLNASSRSGRATEVEYRCESWGGKVPYRVTQCDSFVPKEIFDRNTPSFRKYSEQSWVSYQLANGAMSWCHPHDLNRKMYEEQKKRRQQQEKMRVTSSEEIESTLSSYEDIAIEPY